jgi:hypothetical protein
MDTSRTNGINKPKSQVQAIEEEMEGILSCLLVIEYRGYFGPQGQAPEIEGFQQPMVKRKKDSHSTQRLHQRSQFHM